MERLTKPGVAVEPTAAQFMGAEIRVENLKPRLLDLILNGPTLNAVNKDVLRHMIRQLYDRLQRYEDTGLTPEQIRNAQETLQCFDNIGIKRGNEIVTAEEEGRLVALPCKIGDAMYMKIGDDETLYFVDTGKVFAIGIDERGTMWISVRYDCGLKFYHPSADIGKTCFLTREEAETALKGENHDA